MDPLKDKDQAATPEQQSPVDDQAKAELEAYKAQLAAELEAAKAELAAEREAKEQAQKAAKSAESALQRSGAPGPIKGEYNGYRFADGYRRVRDQRGQICDTEMLLDQAAQGDETAKGILDWLIKIKHKSFTKGATEAPAKAAKKQK